MEIPQKRPDKSDGIVMKKESKPEINHYTYEGNYGKVRKSPEFIKVSFQNQIYKLRPLPSNYEILLSSISRLIPNIPSNKWFVYQDESGDNIKVCNDQSLRSYYEDLTCNPNIYLVLEANITDIVEKYLIHPEKKHNEDDLVNLILLGIVDINEETLAPVKKTQTNFAKNLISDILQQENETSIEQVSEQFDLPWEVVFFIKNKKNIIQNYNKKVNYQKLRHIFLPSTCKEIVQDFSVGKITREEIFDNYKISETKFLEWCALFEKNVKTNIKPSKYSDKEKLKLISCYLLDKITQEELKEGFGISSKVLNSWIHHFSVNKNMYERERFISAEEKYDILQRYFKGEYSVGQFQNEFGVKGNLLYNWVKLVQSGKKLKGSTIFRTASEELERAYEIFLSLYQ